MSATPSAPARLVENTTRRAISGRRNDVTRRRRWPHLAAGLAFRVYPYFATSVASLVVGGVALGVALWLAVRAGW
jgi:hypothetical protein